MPDGSYESDEHRLVTNAKLKEELDKRPTTWEVRTLILAAIVANQMLPGVDFAKAAIRMFK